MATTNLATLAGNLSIGQDAATPILIDVSNFVTNFVIGVSVDQVEIPQTMGTDKTARPGSRTFSVTINYLNDPGTNTLFDMLYTAAIGDGYLFFSGSTFDGSVSAANPLWSGEFIVSGAETGGDMGSFGQTSASFTLTKAPTKATS